MRTIRQAVHCTLAVGTPPVILAIALLTASTLANAQPVDLRARYQFQIPAESLTTALAAFSAATHIHVVTSALAPQVLSPGVHGQLSSQNALTALLHGTGMSYRQVNSDSVAVAPARLAQLRPAAISAGRGGPGRTRE